MENTPSRTALRVALRRAAHQLYDAEPLVFRDPLAVRVLGRHAEELTRTPGSGAGPRAPVRVRTHSYALRAFLVGRSRYTEDALAEAVARGVTQYVLLGAGLDTFAHRNPYPGLRVFEVDHPATQGWKRELLAETGLEQPENLMYVPTDFETDVLGERLQECGADVGLPTFFGWLGVVPYLTAEAFEGTLGAIARFARGSGVVFDYGLPRECLSGAERVAHDSLAERVQLAGEPFRLFFTPAGAAAALGRHGIAVEEDLDGTALNARYFDSRGDRLRVMSAAAHLVRGGW